MRVDNVVKNLFNYFKANKVFLNEDLIENFNKKIINHLHKKTAFKYPHDIDFHQLLPPLPLKWPIDLTQIGITENEKIAMEDAFSQVLPDAFGEDFDHYKLICDKKKIDGKSQRKLILLKKNDLTTIKEFNIPITFTVHTPSPDSIRLSHIILWTKIAIDKGAQRKVKKCYNLMTGEYLARKKSCSILEKIILSHFKSQPSPGIESIDYTEKAFKNEHFIQPIYDGNLKNFENQITDPKDVFSIIHQLATGLSALHAFQPTQTEKSRQKINNKIIEKTTTTTYVNSFHWDIKPENILIKKSLTSNGWKGVLSDFGISTLTPGNGTMYWLSPEDFKFKKTLESSSIPSEEIAKQILAYYQKKDVWALGLVFLRLLTQKYYIVSINEGPHAGKKYWCNYLPSFVNLIFKDSQESWDNLSELNQTSLDSDIANLRTKMPFEYLSLWDKLIPKMLQVDPEKRISANEVVQILSGIDLNSKLDLSTSDS